MCEVRRPPLPEPAPHVDPQICCISEIHVAECIPPKLFPLVSETHMHLKGNVNHMFDIYLYLTMVFSIKEKNVN